MATYLLKTEPDEFSYEDLVRARREPWDGVTAPAAQKAMRAMKKGDEAFIYHTGGERALVGLSRVVRGAYPDPDKRATLASGEPKYVLVDVAPVKRAESPVTLASIKADGRFAEFALVKQSRLSVMEVPPALDRALRKMAGI